MSATPVQGPATVEGLNVRRTLLEDLALKTLFVLGEMSMRHLADHMCLRYGLLEDLFHRLRKDQLCEVRGMLAGVHRLVAVTEAGAARAQQLLSLSGYIGPAPVSLDDYVMQVRQQSLKDMQIHREDMERAFAELVVDDAMLAQLGTAVVSGRTIFLYGPAGTGKSTIAEHLSHLYEAEHVWIPWAVEVDGQIIVVHDPVIHQPVEQTDEGDSDRRWVLCHRPRVLVGGEMTIDMLDLQFNPGMRYYSAPVQMKANNGMLIVDDFGRQRIQPEELLNRWIVPLDRRIDFLTLTGGRKLEIPFDLFVVFATNIDPKKLADEAFLRRIQTKIKVDVIAPEQFHEIFRRECHKNQLAYDPAVVDALVNTIRETYRQPLRACHPRDIIQQVLWSAAYRNQAPALDEVGVAQACRNYFVED